VMPIAASVPWSAARGPGTLHVTLRASVTCGRLYCLAYTPCIPPGDQAGFQ
jgi:hypothetical protein